MTYSGPFRNWDSFRPLDSIASLWSSAMVSQHGSGSAGAYRTVFTTLRRLIVGRRLNIGLDSGEITLTVTEFESDLDMRGLSVGQLNDVSLSVAEISWNGHQLDRATVVMHNVHIKPATPPVLVTAPLDLTVEVSPAVVDTLFDLAAPQLTGRVDANGVAQIRWARRPGLGHLEVDAAIDGSTLLVRPRVLVLRRTRWNLPSRVPAYRMRLPTLPRELELTAISFGPNTVHLRGRVAEWQVDVPGGRLEDVINQLSGMGRLRQW
ncbi:hypothetical protein BTO20_21785 [Mycobacterium dioxanotrophicus]|jgi:hypothetical protein|uniref:DUF2993 domain-containing protein n=1 Tax=Mycobacterium dioxanotrophicus TaxID=482462 RepID=A0A1Y0C6U6_9MYCO|nr:hypothetical protein [Mycobacterium dioxanotrophicus]ART70817.1 hypothetical protein BTO20_21785 [Mycobacterium dioxanotrophicus]